jgi:hypothetical protein
VELGNIYIIIGYNFGTFYFDFQLIYVESYEEEIEIIIKIENFYAFHFKMLYVIKFIVFDYFGMNNLLDNHSINYAE